MSWLDIKVLEKKVFQTPNQMKLNQLKSLTAKSEHSFDKIVSLDPEDTRFVCAEVLEPLLFSSHS